MKRIRYMIASLIVACVGLGAVVTPVYAADQSSGNTPTQTACEAVTGDASCNDSSGGPSVESIVHTVVNVLSLIVGIAAVIMLIIGGFRFVTSSGDSNTVASARNTIIYSLIGLVIVALAQFIVQFVVNKTVTNTGKKSGLVVTERFAALPGYRILN